MKLKQLVLLLLAVLACTLLLVVSARGQQPENLTITWNRWSSAPACNLLRDVTTCGPSAEGIWVAVFISDSEVQAVSITLSYRDGTGRDLTRTELVQRWYRDRPSWTNYLFVVGSVKVKSILVTPLKAAEQTKFVTVEEP